MLDLRTAQNDMEDMIRDAILYAIGKRSVTVATVAALRAYVTRGATSGIFHDDSLAVIKPASTVTAAYRWNQASTAADNGTTVVKPNDVTGAGRWLRWTSSLRFAPTVGGNSYYLHELASGYLERVILLDKSMTDEEINSLIFGQVPSVIIEASDDTPEEATQITSHRWLTNFDFTVSVIAQNLRDRRQAAQGSTLDSTTGANTLDGLIQSLLCGPQLYNVEDGVRNIKPGRGFNWQTGQGQRRVIRQRLYTVQATVENPNAANDAGDMEEVDTQANLTALGDTPDTAIDLDNVVTSGMTLLTGVGLTKTIAAGAATFDGDAITYAGQLKTFTANKETYRDLLPNGTMAFVEVDIGAAEPDVTATAYRIGVTLTDTDGIVSDRMIAPTYVTYGPLMQITLT